MTRFNTRRLGGWLLLTVIAAAFVLLHGATSASATGATFTVTSTADTDGATCGSGCTLRQAINAANTNPGSDTIRFAIGSGAATIQITGNLGQLPSMTQPVIIDGLSQPGSPTCAPRSLTVQLAGPGWLTGLHLGAGSGGSLISGLAISGFETGLLLESTANEVRCNNLGTDVTGMSPLPNLSYGIRMAGSATGNVVGGLGAGDFNVISGTGLGNCNSGGHAVGIQGPDAHSNQLLGNRIGVGADGASPIRNCRGVQVTYSNGNQLSGNTIAHNDAGALFGWGIVIGPLYDQTGTQLTPQPTGNRISQNSIFDNRPDSPLGGQGSGQGINANVPRNPPNLSSALLTGGTVAIAGNVSGAADATVTIELFKNVACDPSGRGEGQTYLTTLTAVIPAGNTGTQFNVGLGGLVEGDIITATATASDGTTSTFSNCVTVIPPQPSVTYVVNDAGDVNHGTCGTPCTLRDAINAANGHFTIAGQPDVITFASGVGTILVSSPLPNVNDPVVINGTAQALGSACTSHQLTVQISPAQGANFGGPGLALTTAASGSSIRGLAIGGFGPRGANLAGPGLRIDGNGNTVECSNFGTDASGTVAQPNANGIVINGGANNIIRNNVLSGNRYQDLSAAANWGGRGLVIQFASATGNHVVGNLIGTDATGRAALPNQVGVNIQGASGNFITGNVISGNSVPTNTQSVAGAAVILNFYSPTWASPSTTPPPAGTTWPDSNHIENNLIGVAYDGVTNLDGVTPLTSDTPLPNQRGITINSGNNNRIIGNTIAYNDGAILQGWGINIFPANSTMPKPAGNTISRNLIYKNKGTAPAAHARGGMNISNPAGPANISLVTPPDAAGQVTVDVYWRRATPLQPTTFEVFASPVCDEWGAGEGKRYVGSVTVEADETGRAAASAQFPGLAADDLLTATATRADGTTSHFSLCVTSSITITSLSPIVAGTTDAQVTIIGTGFGADTMPSMQDTSGNPLLLDVISTNYTAGNHNGTEIVTRIPASQHTTPGWSSAIVVSKYSDPDPTRRAWPSTLKLGSSVAKWFTVDTATATTAAVLTVSTGGTEDQAASITATTGSGTGTVGVAGYPANPAGATNFATAGSFFDVYVTTGSLFPSLTITYCDPGGGNVVYWWTGEAWVPASNQVYVPATGCVIVTVDSATTPSLDQLVGSVLASAFNRPPVAGEVAGPSGPLALGSPATISFPVSDLDDGDTHAATIDWGDGDVSHLAPSAGTEFSGVHAYAQSGVYSVSVVTSDNHGGVSEVSHFKYVIVYDPSAGFVTGGGWITSPAEAYAPDPALTGKATFGFVSQYKKGANVPTGNTQFQFHTAGLDFKSTSYEWLVIAGAKAQYKGEGTINGQGSYRFMLTAIDGQVNGGGGVDKFRIRIWSDSGGLVYDNQLSEPDDASPSIALGAGSIVIHKEK